MDFFLRKNQKWVSKFVEHYVIHWLLWLPGMWWVQKRSELSSPLGTPPVYTPHFWCWQQVADTSYTEGRRRKVEKRRMWKSESKWEGEIRGALLLIHDVGRKNCVDQSFRREKSDHTFTPGIQNALSYHRVSACARYHGREEQMWSKGGWKEGKGTDAEAGDQSVRTPADQERLGQEIKLISPRKYMLIYKWCALIFIKKLVKYKLWHCFSVSRLTQIIAMLKFLPCYSELGCLLEQMMILRSQLDTTE